MTRGEDARVNSNDKTFDLLPVRDDSLAQTSMTIFALTLPQQATRFSHRMPFDLTDSLEGQSKC